MPQLFRSMQDDGTGAPAVGPSARRLGVRPGRDVPATHPLDWVYPGGGGLSVSPHTPMNIHRHRRPRSLQGIGKDPVWQIDSATLPPNLTYRADPNSTAHGFIEPAVPMTLGDFQAALAASQSLWQAV